MSAQPITVVYSSSKLRKKLEAGRRYKMHVTRKLIPIYMLAILMLGQGLAISDGYKVDWNSINSGGGQSSGGGCVVTCAIGQTAAGFTQSAERLHWMGFWSGGIPAPMLAMRVADVKMLPIGAFVTAVGKVATSVEGDLPGYLYVEDEDRKGGIRVVIPGGLMSSLERGKSVVNVIGTAGIADNHERQITASLVIVTSTRTDPLGPVIMNNKTIGGADFGVPPLGQLGVTDGVGLNTVGLLIMTPGRVQEAGTGYLLISDGSALPVRISTEGFTNLPGEGDYIVVTGISSLYPSGADKLRLVLPRQRSDIWPQ